MSSRSLVLLSTCAAALLAPCGGAAALTGNRACSGPTIAADAAFHERFPELLAELRTELPGRQGVDACARVELRAQAVSTLIEVALPDGRTTSRDVSQPDDLLPTLQALLLVPEPVPALAGANAAASGVAPPPKPAAPANRPAPAGLATTRSDARDVRPPSHDRERDYGFEVALVSGVRVGDGQYGYGAGVLSLVELKRWLVGFQGRADGYRTLEGSDPETALALGVLFGRRFDLGSTALDLTAGPALALRSQGDGVSVQARPSATTVAMAPPERNVSPVPRLLLGARLGFSPRSVLRGFIGIDGELGPRGGAEVVTTALEASARMPAYTVGLALGATLGTR